MEDKWFVFEERGRLYFHRSWTGFCVYEVVLRKIPSGAEIVEAWVNRDPSQYSEPNDARDGLILAFLVDELLLGRRGVWPESGLGQEALRQWSVVGRAMLAHDEDGKAAKKLEGEIRAARDAPRGGEE
jgi:hypothetical protein